MWPSFKLTQAMYPQQSDPPPLHYLRWFSIFLFFLSLAAMFLAGLFYREMTAALAADFAPEGGLPGELHFSVSLAVSIGLGILAGMVYVGAALTERLLDLR
jgi:hypothetical protein